MVFVMCSSGVRNVFVMCSSGVRQVFAVRFQWAPSVLPCRVHIYTVYLVFQEDAVFLTMFV